MTSTYLLAPLALFASACVIDLYPRAAGPESAPSAIDAGAPRAVDAGSALDAQAPPSPAPAAPQADAADTKASDAGAE